MLLGITGSAARTGTQLWLYPFAIGGASILASLVGVQFDRLRAGGKVIDALMRAVFISTILAAGALVPITMAFDAHGSYSFGHLYGSALIGLG